MLHVIVSSAYTLYMMTWHTVVNGNRIAYDDISHHMERAMPVQEKEWEDRAKGILKGELKRRGVTYADLVGKLAAIGVMDSEPNIRNKLSRGKFTAVFMLQCLKAIEVTNLQLTD